MLGFSIKFFGTKPVAVRKNPFIDPCCSALWADASWEKWRSA